MIPSLPSNTSLPCFSPLPSFIPLSHCLPRLSSRVRSSLRLAGAPFSFASSLNFLTSRDGPSGALGPLPLSPTPFLPLLSPLAALALLSPPLPLSPCPPSTWPSPPLARPASFWRPDAVKCASKHVGIYTFREIFMILRVMCRQGVSAEARRGGRAAASSNASRRPKRLLFWLRSPRRTAARLGTWPFYLTILQTLV